MVVVGIVVVGFVVVGFVVVGFVVVGFVVVGFVVVGRIVGHVVFDHVLIGGGLGRARRRFCSGLLVVAASGGQEGQCEQRPQYCDKSPRS